MDKRVLIIGGGLAGLSAAAVLANHNLQVTLLESRPRLGGRAGSFLDRDSGEWIDTCQHVAMGCCTNLLHFCRMVGIDDLFRTESQLTFIGPAGQRSCFRENIGPAPLHLLGAGVRMRHLTLREKLRLALDLRALAQAKWAEAEDLAFNEWLEKHGRTADLQERFWDVILVSALSESIDRISTSAARKVFVDGFLGNRNGWRVHVPTAPLDEIYGERMTDWLCAQGADVHVQSGVVQLEEQHGSITSAALRSGDRIAADEFILAVPWYRLRDLVPSMLKDSPTIAGVSQLESAPITSVHLWFDRPVIDVPHAVLIGKLSQWVFARSGPGKASAPEVTPRATEGGHSSRPISGLNDESAYLQVVISASRQATEIRSEDLIGMVVSELASVWPEAAHAELRHARVVTEHRAVFSPLPGSERYRPRQQSPIDNLQLAGDWTDTDWPATMEGAVRSGFLAAENVLKRIGDPVSVVQPGLPVSRFASILLGLSVKPVR